MIILKMAVPAPLFDVLDYALPDTLGDQIAGLQPGIRAQIPLGRSRQVIGIVMQITDKTNVPANKLKSIIALLDKTPVLSSPLLALARFASHYYHYPIGEVCALMLPVWLRRGHALIGEQTQTVYCLSDKKADLTVDDFKRAKRQQQLFTLLQTAKQGLSRQYITQWGIPGSVIEALLKKSVIIAEEKPVTHAVTSQKAAPHPPVVLNEEQQCAVNTMVKALSTFRVFLLQGVTGSGKTQVYFDVMSQVLAQGRQVLFLVPEIGLTPQTVGRVQQRFAVPIALLHSGLNDKARVLAWEQAQSGYARIVIGTRSALFVPLKQAGLFVIDEEHDLSFKQQDGLRYSARDLAIKRAEIEKVPIILGSATPALESIYNAKMGRYHPLYLHQRAGNAVLPDYQLIDLRMQPLNHGISVALRDAIAKTLKQGHQVLVFLNRRGYAPVLICHECAWSAQCHQCDARMTLHQSAHYLQCHHCGIKTAIPKQCPDCQCQQLIPVGIGTQRVADALAPLFPDVPILRIDADTTRQKGAMQSYVKTIHDGKPCILLGTQLLAKGHHFPHVTLVAIVEADSGLYSADFRAMEHLAQLLLQVGGRAGRAEKKGNVLIQTHMPQHPLLQQLIHSGYSAFADTTLSERQAAGLPPFACLALLRAESKNQQNNLQLLNQIKTTWASTLTDAVTVLEPIPAAMARRAGFYRAQLLIRSNQRKVLHQALKALIAVIEQCRSAKVHWILDVDPQIIL